jgi:gamma-glutamyltranspeptidase/glutathione hydrolase
MKSLFAILVTTFMGLAISGCNHPIEIAGKGDVRSASGTRNCSWQEFQAKHDNCRNNIVIGDYDEIYFGEPHAGWKFERWENYCTDATDNRCSFRVPANTVEQYFGQTVPPLVAIFSPASGFSEGVVSAPHPLATEAGARVLEAGGNAVDAAAVIQFVLNVVEPTSSGIGGGGFMGVHLASENRSFFIDAREKAPAAASPTMFLRCDPNCNGSDNQAIGSYELRASSGISVGVPGTLSGVATALEKYGTLTLAQALQPAIQLAENGFNIDQRLATLSANPRVGYWPESAAIFRTANGGALPVGYKLVQADLAKTLRLIAQQGIDVFYSGEIAQAIVNAQRRARSQVGPKGAGRMSMRDLAAYRSSGVEERDPVVSQYRGATILGMPAPSAGGYAVAQILECIEQFPIGNAAAGFGPGALKTLHVMTESMRLAFSSRNAWMGDGDKVQLPLAGLTSPGYLAPRCAQIKTDRRMPTPPPGDPRNFDPAFTQSSALIAGNSYEPAGMDTTHISVIDRDGNVVTYTTSLSSNWGSGITVPGYGFLLNNQLNDFNLVPSAKSSPAAFNPGANDVAPGKRPRSSMAPVMVFKNDKLVAAYGSPGGSAIINAVVNMTVNLIDHNMSVQQAIDAPRFHTYGGPVEVEPGFRQAVLDGFKGLGHSITLLSGGKPVALGSVQAIVVDPVSGKQNGGADTRRSATVTGLPRR